MRFWKFLYQTKVGYFVMLLISALLGITIACFVVIHNPIGIILSVMVTLYWIYWTCPLRQCWIEEIIRETEEKYK